ncbi:MAG: TRAP transporter substrate-binding protein [Candidatus Adiutrix sp.]|jgi:TRAP-type C4-dicarboxylate transport system substrate-binding protein|nr:TRAP transporter substrate-binding protein [Candidatus Adiutrix sp.]
MSFTRKLTLVLFSALLLALLPGCGDDDDSQPSSSAGGTPKAETGKKVTLKLTHNAGTGQSIDLATAYLAREVKQRSDGRIEIQVFPNNVMGPEVACRDMLVNGAIDMTSMGCGILSNWSGAVQIVQSLYAFESEEELMEIMTGEFGQKYFYGPFLKEQNVRVLDQWPQSARQLISKKPVRTVADLPSLKLRTPSGIPVWEAGWSIMGVMALSLALDEAFTGMQQGVCDAVEMPLEFIRAYRFAEEAKYLTMTNHNIYTQFLLINDNSWKKLSEEDQKILSECVLDARKFAYEKRNEADSKILEEFARDGVEIIHLTPEVLAGFQQKVQPSYTELMSLWGEDVYKDFTAAIQKYRSGS